MDTSEFRQKGRDLIRKYRYAIFVLLTGIILMLLPSAREKPVQELVTIREDTQEQTFEDRLAETLSQIQGAGRVAVFLSQASGETYHYQTDEDLRGDSSRADTVLITAADRSQSGLIQQVDSPVYQGAIILCQGADNAAIRLSITQAVANVTGLGTNQISVLKMK